MSSLRNATQRRNHKERSQPLKREKLGILEKHKDYALRAKDYNNKKKRLRYLRQKATERNPDEFHFGMMKSQTDKFGRKIAERGNTGLSDSSVRLLKTQDAGYLRMMMTKTRLEREQLEEGIIIDGSLKHNLHSGKLTGSEQSGTKTVFTDDSRSQEQYSERLHYDTADRFNLDKPQNIELSAVSRLGGDRSKQGSHSRLEILKTREKELGDAEAVLDTERAQMNNSIGGSNRNSIKFKSRVRKR